VRQRTKNFETRFRALNEWPLITPLLDFAPREDEEYFVVPTTPQKVVLIEYLISYKVRQLISKLYFDWKNCEAIN
jgi:hypothetical protein